MNTHVTQLFQMTKLSIKQCQSCTTPKIHRETIPTKILATNFAAPAQIGKNDQLSSNSMPVVHKGAVLLAKNQVSRAKSEEYDSLCIEQHVLTVLKIKSNTHPLRFVVLYSGCHQGSTSTAFITFSSLLLLF